MRANVRTIGLVVLVLVLIVAAYGAYAWFFNAKSSRLAHLQWGDFIARFGPRDARGGSFLLTLRNGGAVYADGMLNYDEYIAGRLTLDYDRNGSAHAIITYEEDKTASYELRVDGVRRAHSNAPLQSVSLSPSGDAFAYARLVRPDAILNDIRSWEAVIVLNDEERVLGNAFSAAFLSEDMLALMGEQGISIVGLDGIVRSTIARSFLAPTGVRVAANEDGAMLAVAEGGLAEVYAVDVGEGTAKKVFATEVGAASSIEVTADALYTVVQDEDESSEIVRYAFDGSVSVVRRFAPAISVAKIDL